MQVKIPMFILGAIVGGLASWFLQAEPDPVINFASFDFNNLGAADVAEGEHDTTQRFFKSLAGSAVGGVGFLLFGFLWDRERRHREEDHDDHDHGHHHHRHA